MSLSTSEIQQKVKELMTDFVQRSSGWDGEIENDMQLINGGVIDSISLVGLVSILQQEFDIEISVPDITVENFDSVDAITQFVESKMAEAA